MLVSYRYNFIFIKTFRCASTSVEVALQNLCLPEGAEEPSLDTGQIMTSAGIIGSRKVRPTDKSAPTFYNHITACALHQELGADAFSGFTKIAIIRNPYDQIVSWFLFRIHSRINKLPLYRDKSTKDQFRLWINSPAPHLPTYWSMLSIDDTCAIDKIIHYENIDTEFERVYSEIAPEKNTPRLSVLRQTRRQNKNYMEMYDETSKALVATYFKREIDEFGYDFQ